jgi:hypothetical protein
LSVPSMTTLVGAAVKRSRMAQLQLLNLRSRRPVTGDADVVVSLTSFGSRLKTVHLTIESIGQGTTRPRRLILWLDAADLEPGPPAPLRRLQARGLEVRTCPNDRSYRKIYPYAVSQPHHATACATADDDVLYPTTWLAELLSAHRGAPDCVNGHRARRIGVDGGRIAPYQDWAKCTDSLPGHDRFLTGVSGIIYPPAFLDALRDAGDGFRTVCPTADDVWLHHVALRGGFRHRQVSPTCTEYPTLPRTQAVSLMGANADRGGNDVQIARLYDGEDIAVLSSPARPARLAQQPPPD